MGKEVGAGVSFPDEGFQDSAYFLALRKEN